MLGKKPSSQRSLFSPARRETRVSNQLKELRKIVDFGWFRDGVKDKFCLDNGRPSIAPEVLCSMVFLGYWFNITSDRELCEECEDRLSFREFIGIGEQEEVPVHSSLTHWRARLGREVFAGFLAHTVELASKKGLKPGRCRLFDSTLVKAQADAGGPSCVKLDPTKDTNDYLEALGQWEACESNDDDKDNPDKWKKQEAKRKLRDGVAIEINTNDMDARLVGKPGKKTDFYHKCHFELDASSGLVMNADACHVSDAGKMLDFLERERGHVDTVVGDCGYFTYGSELWLKEHSIQSMISVHDKSNNAGRVFGMDAFCYVDETDSYVCPAGHTLSRQGTSSSPKKRYAISRGVCPRCELQSYCFRAGEKGARRELGVNAQRELVEDARRCNRTWRYKRLSNRRRVLCEGSFAVMKMHGGLGRARGIGEESMAIQAIMSGVAHNLKKLLKHLRGLEAAADRSIKDFLLLLKTPLSSFGERLRTQSQPLAA